MSALNKVGMSVFELFTGFGRWDPMDVVLKSKRELNRIDVLARLDGGRLMTSAAADLMRLTRRQSAALDAWLHAVKSTRLSAFKSSIQGPM